MTSRAAIRHNRDGTQDLLIWLHNVRVNPKNGWARFELANREFNPGIPFNIFGRQFPSKLVVKMYANIPSHERRWVRDKATIDGVLRKKPVLL